MKTTDSSRSAFSLIELLVVIAIIGTLAALSVNLLSGAKTRAQGVECQKNLGDWAKAFGIYVDSNRAHMVPTTGADGLQDPMAWFNVLARQLDEKPISAYGEGETVPRPKAGIKSVFVCPSADNHGDKSAIFSYAYNRHLVDGEKRLRAPQVKNPSELVVFMDAPLLKVPVVDETVVTVDHSQSFRHSHRANIAFFDGHVAAFQKQDVLQGIEAPKEINVAGIQWDPWPESSSK